MSYFVEPLITEHLWYWLESEKGWQIDSEVSTGDGRIDLACMTGDGRYVGIEVKARSGLSYHSSLPEQLWRYKESGLFDAVYFASPEPGEAATRLRSPEPVRGIVRHVIRKLRAGVQTGHYDAEMALDRIEREIDDNILSTKIERDKSSYVASGGRPIRDFIRENLKTEIEPSVEPITLDAAIRELSRSVLPPEVGLIEIPLPLNDGVLQRPGKALTPGALRDPKIIRRAAQLSRTGSPGFSPRGEPQIRHAVWRELGGLPEGVIPNVTESEQRERPIDLVAFKGDWDPARICRDPGSGEVIGVEVKGRSSYSPSRITRQLGEYLEPNVFSQLYLALPVEIADRAMDLIADHDDLSKSVGVLAVDEEGAVALKKNAPSLPLQHDGIKHGKVGIPHGSVTYKTGYGDIQIAGGAEVSSPFVLSEWRDPLTGPDGKPVGWDYAPRETDRVIRDIAELDVPKPTKADQQKSESGNASTARAYLLQGYSADPNAEGRESAEWSRAQMSQSRRKKGMPKYGYVRLSVRGFEADTGNFVLVLHFGRGSREGGYICLVSDQIDLFVSILSSLEHIDGGKVPGRGDYIELPSNRKLNVVTGGPKERPLHLEIEADRRNGEVGAILQIAEDRHAGVEVKITETQRIDLLRTIRVLRYGRSSEIPGWEDGNQRIGPDGNDTWDWGVEVEKIHDPGFLGGPPPSKEEIWKDVEERDGGTNSGGADEDPSPPGDFHREVLEEYFEIGMYGVSILSRRDEYTCKKCLDHDGTTYTLEEALEKSPLPHDECSNPECRCDYMPIGDKETFEQSTKPDLSDLHGS